MAGMIWKTIESPIEEGKWVAAQVYPLVNGDSRVEHLHPIPFDSQREADRAVARLNARDAA